jgi:hypothetical protein
MQTETETQGKFADIEIEQQYLPSELIKQKFKILESK